MTDVDDHDYCIFLFLHMMRIFIHSNDDMPHLPPISAIDECLPNKTWQPPLPPSSSSQQSSPSTSSYSLSSSNSTQYAQQHATIPLHPQSTHPWTIPSRQNDIQVTNHPDLPQVKRNRCCLVAVGE